jgi:signal transduction histidine kinase
MRNRLQQIGGRFSLESAPGLGTKVHLTVPLGSIVKPQEH